MKITIPPPNDDREMLLRGCGEGWASATLNRATNRSFENIYMRMNIYMKAAMATNPFLLLLRASVPAVAGTEDGDALTTLAIS